MIPWSLLTAKTDEELWRKYEEHRRATRRNTAVVLVAAAIGGIGLLVCAIAHAFG